MTQYIVWQEGGDCSPTTVTADTPRQAAEQLAIHPDKGIVHAKGPDKHHRYAVRPSLAGGAFLYITKNPFSPPNSVQLLGLCKRSRNGVFRQIQRPILSKVYLISSIHYIMEFQRKEIDDTKKALLFLNIDEHSKFKMKKPRNLSDYFHEGMIIYGNVDEEWTRFVTSLQDAYKKTTASTCTCPGKSITRIGLKGAKTDTKAISETCNGDLVISVIPGDPEPGGIFRGAFNTVITCQGNNVTTNQELLDLASKIGFPNLDISIPSLDGQQDVDAWKKYVLRITQGKVHIPRELTAYELQQSIISPYINKVARYGQHDDLMYGWLEQAQTHEIRDTKEEEGTTEEKECSRWDLLEDQSILPALKQLASGVKAIHDNNIVHRDLKADNIGFKKVDNSDIQFDKSTTDSYQVQILDFGLAERVDDKMPQAGPQGTPCQTVYPGTDYLRTQKVRTRHNPYVADVWAFYVVARGSMKMGWINGDDNGNCCPSFATGFIDKQCQLKRHTSDKEITFSITPQKVSQTYRDVTSLDAGERAERDKSHHHLLDVVEKEIMRLGQPLDNDKKKNFDHPQWDDIIEACKPGAAEQAKKKAEKEKATKDRLMKEAAEKAAAEKAAAEKAAAEKAAAEKAAAEKAAAEKVKKATQHVTQLQKQLEELNKSYDEAKEKFETLSQDLILDVWDPDNKDTEDTTQMDQLGQQLDTLEEQQQQVNKKLENANQELNNARKNTNHPEE